MFARKLLYLAVVGLFLGGVCACHGTADPTDGAVSQPPADASTTAAEREGTEPRRPAAPSGSVRTALPLLDATVFPSQMQLRRPATVLSVRRPTEPQRLSLIVGANTFSHHPEWNLDASNALQRMRETLSGPLQVPAENQIELIAEQAIGSRIAEVLNSGIDERAAVGDVLLYFVWLGASVVDPVSDVRDLTLLTHTARFDSGSTRLTGGMPARDVAMRLTQMRSRLQRRGVNLRIVTVIDSWAVSGIGRSRPANPALLGDVTLYSATDSFPLRSPFIPTLADTLSDAMVGAGMLGAGGGKGAVRWADVMNDLRQRLPSDAPSPAMMGDLSRPLTRPTGISLAVLPVDAMNRSAGVIGDAEVTLNEMVSMSRGTAEFTGLETGRVFLRVRAPGYFWRYEEVPLPDSEATQMTLTVPLVPQFTLVTGRLRGTADAMVTVEIANAEKLGGRRIGLHVMSAPLRADGAFTLVAPALPLDAEIRIRAAHRPSISLGVIEATPTFADVPIDVTETVGLQLQRVAHYDFGDVDVAPWWRTRPIFEVGEGLKAQHPEFPAIAFGDSNSRTMYRLASEQAKSQRLEMQDIALETLSGLIEDVALTDPTVAARLDLLREAVLETYLVKLHEIDPEWARGRLRALLEPRSDRAGFTTRGAGARTQYVRWLAHAADRQVERHEFQAALATLDDAAFVTVTGDVTAALAQHRMRIYAAWVRHVVRDAMATGIWSPVRDVLSHIYATLPEGATLDRWPSVIRRESIVPATRAQIEAGHAAYFSGDLDAAETFYLAALPTANGFYKELALAQIIALAGPQFDRYFLIGAIHQSRGDRPAALQAYLQAFRFRPSAVAPLFTFFSEQDSALTDIWATHGQFLTEWHHLRDLELDGDPAHRLAAIETLIARFPTGPLRPALEFRRQSLRSQFLSTLPVSARAAFHETAPVEQGALLRLPAEKRLFALTLPNEPDDLRGLFLRACALPGFTFARQEIIAGKPRLIFRCDALAKASLVPPDVADVACEFVLIPGGLFSMGSAGEAGIVPDDEAPARTVRVAPFLLARTEITLAVWDGLTNRTDAIRLDPRLPATGMSWQHATDVLKRHGLRLPSEAEWEFACRAGSPGQYHHGDEAAELHRFAWFIENASNRPQRVAQLLPNAFGLFDMHGNVWEWCADTYQPNYVGAPTDSRAWIVEQSGPPVPRVRRGGSWGQSAWYCRSALRMWGHALAATGDTGIRPAITIP